jgi:hypothetical protein
LYISVGSLFDIVAEPRLYKHTVQYYSNTGKRTGCLLILLFFDLVKQIGRAVAVVLGREVRLVKVLNLFEIIFRVGGLYQQEGIYSQFLLQHLQRLRYLR